MKSIKNLFHDAAHPLVNTQYGFKWYHVEVSRTAEYKGQVILHIHTPRKSLEVRVTPTGLIKAKVLQ